MKIDSTPPAWRRGHGPPREGKGRAPSVAAGVSRAGAAALALALALGCGGGASQEPLEISACSSDDDCAEGQQCSDAACVVSISPRGPNSAGAFACSVVSCPRFERGCCSAALASATGNERQGYASRDQMVDRAYSVRGQVRADFSFDAADQQGWLTFELGAELDLARLEFTGRHLGVADRILSVNTNQGEGAGCAYAFQLSPRPGSAGGGSFAFGDDIAFNVDDFCYGDAQPGRASAIAFAIFSVEPGDASLIISNIDLVAD